MCRKRTTFDTFTALNAIFAVLDVVSDLLTLPVYWNGGIHSIFCASCVFFILSVPVAIAQVVVSAVHIKQDDDGGFKNKNSFLLLVETLVDSAPQLILNIIALSICGGIKSPIQILSITLSCLAIAWRLFDIESDRSGPLSFPMLMVYAYVYVTKLVYASARIFVLAYFCFYLGWWIFVAFALRWLLWIFGSRFLSFETSAKEIIFSVFVQTLGFGAVPPEGPIALVLPMWTALENICLAIGTFEYSQSQSFRNHDQPYAGLKLVDPDDFIQLPSVFRQPFQTSHNGTYYPDFCLYAHPLAVHISLNVIIMMLVVGQSFLPVKRKDNPWSEMTFLLRNQD